MPQLDKKRHSKSKKNEDLQLEWFGNSIENEMQEIIRTRVYVIFLGEMLSLLAHQHLQHRRLHRDRKTLD